MRRRRSPPWTSWGRAYLTRWWTTASTLRRSPCFSCWRSRRSSRGILRGMATGKNYQGWWWACSWPYFQTQVFATKKLLAQPCSSTTCTKVNMSYVGPTSTEYALLQIPSIYEASEQLRKALLTWNCLRIKIWGLGHPCSCAVFIQISRNLSH